MARGDRGIGRAASLCLANKGHKVCIGIGYREREDCAHEVVEKIRHFGGTAIAAGCDLLFCLSLLRTSKTLCYNVSVQNLYR